MHDVSNDEILYDDSFLIHELTECRCWRRGVAGAADAE